ncbi:hypothetical protein D3C81_2039730 [compost metagenome]
MAAQILGRTMYDNICAQLQRPLEERGEQRIIYNREQLMPAGPRTHSSYIGDHHQRVCRSLDKYGLRIRTAGRFEAVKIIGIHIGGRDAVFRQDSFQQTVSPAVQIQ